MSAAAAPKPARKTRPKPPPNPALMIGGPARLAGVEYWLTNTGAEIHVFSTLGGRPARHLGTIKSRDELEALALATAPALAAELSEAERKAERRIFRKAPARQAIPHNFREWVGAEYAPVQRLPLADLLAKIEAAETPAPVLKGGRPLPAWAVVSKPTGSGVHCTTAMHLQSGAMYSTVTHYGTRSAVKGAARARPGAVLYLQRPEVLQRDGLLKLVPVAADCSPEKPRE